jgi:hypothetical protein
VCELGNAVQSVVFSAIQAEEIMGKEKTDLQRVGSVKVATANDGCMLTLRAVPVPELITRYIDSHTIQIKRIVDASATEHDARVFWDGFKAVAKQGEIVGVEWIDICERVFAFGPKRVGGNMLVWDMEDAYIGKT